MFANAALEKLSVLPGVQHAAIACNPPLMTGWQTGFLAEGAPEPPPGQMPSAEMSVVTEDYLHTIGASLLRGRMFDARDTAQAPPVVIVDQLMVEKYFGGGDPIGKRVRMQVNETGREWRTIVGVVPHLKVYGFDEPTSLPQAYLPLTQSPQTGSGDSAADIAAAGIAPRTGATNRGRARSGATGIRVPHHAGAGRGNVGHAASAELSPECVCRRLP